MNNEKMFSMVDAAERLGVSRITICRFADPKCAAKLGIPTMPTLKVGGQRRISDSKWQEWLNEMQRREDERQQKILAELGGLNDE